MMARKPSFRMYALLVVAVYLCLFVGSFQMASAASVPAVLVTELLPNGKNYPNPNTPGKNYDEACEMAEIYNNSGKAIQLKDLQFLLTEPGKEDKLFKWADGYGDKTFPAGSVMVIWFHEDNNPFDFPLFFTHFSAKNPDLKEAQVAMLITQAMTNSTPHTLYILDNAGNKIVAASYTGKGDTVDDKPIKYSYPTDGSINMNPISSGAESLSTPGILEAGQAPGK